VTNLYTDLEISKPQRNSRNAQNAATSGRSRTPDHTKGDHGGRQAQGRGRDRYDPRSGSSNRKDDYSRPLRDDYRPGRSSPPRDNVRRRDDYGYDPSRGGRDAYDRRRSSRSHSPYNQRGEGRYRERSVSPRGRQANEDVDLEIPRRDPRDVPDVQVILSGQLDRGFVSWVEGELRARGLKTEVMFLSPRLPLDTVIRRQILEGVHAVSQLDMRSQNASKIPLQVFDRQGGANNVRFDEYQDLEPKIAAELVLRAKQAQVPVSSYAPPQPQYAQNQSYQPAAAAPVSPDLLNLVGQLDNATLQKLLSTMNIPQPNAPAAAPANPVIDPMAGLLSYSSQYQARTPTTDAYNNPALPSFSPTAAAPPQQAPQQSAQQVQNIMAQLARFRQP
jgi:nuclear polyadenylated RNA-binding protein 3